MYPTKASPSRSGVGRRSPSGPLAAWCLGEAMAHSALVSIAPVMVSRVNRPWPPAVAVLVDGEPGGRGRGTFFPLEQGGFVGVGGLGGDHFEDPPTQDPQCLGVVALREPEQILLGSHGEVGVEVV